MRTRPDRSGSPRCLILALVGVLLASTAACQRDGSPVGSTAPNGHTVVTVHAVDVSGEPATAAQLNAITAQLSNRLAAAGFADPRVQADADGSLTLTLAGTNDPADIKALLYPGELRFRRVLSSDDSAAAVAECARLNDRGVEVSGADRQPLNACDQTGSTRYQLAEATVLGTDVSDAKAERSDAADWVVTISFTSAGQARWTALTAQVSAEQGQVAIVLDQVVITAPTVVSVIPGDAQISGVLGGAQGARQLAAKIKYGALPVILSVADITTIE